jgi:RNA processing factor Prp31
LSLLAAIDGTSLATQLVQVAGALLILAAFAASQLGVLSTQSRLYLALNLVGSIILSVLAAADRQYGFLLLQAAWAAVSAWSLLMVGKNRAPTSAH